MDVFLTPTILSIRFLSLSPDVLSITGLSTDHSRSRIDATLSREVREVDRGAMP